MRRKFKGKGEKIFSCERVAVSFAANSLSETQDGRRRRSSDCELQIFFIGFSIMKSEIRVMVLGIWVLNCESCIYVLHCEL